MMIKREVIEHIGLLDESFFFFVEDAEFCYRAKQKGYGVYYVPAAHVMHVRGGSSAQKDLECGSKISSRGRKIIHCKDIREKCLGTILQDYAGKFFHSLSDCQIFEPIQPALFFLRSQRIQQGIEKRLTLLNCNYSGRPERQRGRGAKGQRGKGAEGQRGRGAKAQRGKGTEGQRHKGQRHRGAKAQRGKGTEGQRHRGAEAQRGKGAEGQRHRGAEAQRGKGAEGQRHKVKKLSSKHARQLRVLQHCDHEAMTTSYSCAFVPLPL